MSKRYEIVSIVDIINIPKDKFDHFLIELRSFYEVNRGIMELVEVAGDHLGVAARVLPQKMVWVDDGKHDVTVHIKSGTREGGDGA